MEVREQFAGVGSLSTMWDLGTEFRLSSLVASIFTYWAISQVPVRKFLNEPAFLFYFLYLHVCVYALRMCIWALPLTCEYVGVRGQCQEPSSIALQFTFWGRVSPWTWSSATVSEHPPVSTSQGYGYLYCTQVRNMATRTVLCLSLCFSSFNTVKRSNNLELPWKQFWVQKLLLKSSRVCGRCF